jgi:TetR/AcrR family transcriptional regulator, repressor for uid operon
MTSIKSLKRGRPVDAQARAERTRHILNAARSCFARKGFHAASTADISAEAGISVANLYQYFPSKNDLIVAMTQDDLQADLAMLAKLSNEADLIGNLDQLLIGIAQEARDAERLRLRLDILAEATRNEPVREALLKADQSLAQTLLHALQKSQKRGFILPQADLKMLVFLFMLVADGFYSRAGFGLATPEQAIAMLKTLLPGPFLPVQA